MWNTGQRGLHGQANRLLRIADNAQDGQGPLFGQCSQRLQQRLLERSRTAVFQALGQIGHAQPRVAQHVQAEVAFSGCMPSMLMISPLCSANSGAKATSLAGWGCPQQGQKVTQEVQHLRSQIGKCNSLTSRAWISDHCQVLPEAPVADLHDHVATKLAAPQMQLLRDG